MRDRILYVDREDSADSDCRRRILRDLQTDYDVDGVIGLTRDVVDLVRQAGASRPYEAIITHVPPGGGGYRDSLDIIAEIIRSTDAPVIAFTSALGGDFFQISQYVDIAVQKSNVLQDLILLREALGRSVGRPVSTSTDSLRRGWRRRRRARATRR